MAAWNDSGCLISLISFGILCSRCGWFEGEMSRPILRLQCLIVI